MSKTVEVSAGEFHANVSGTAAEDWLAIPGGIRTYYFDGYEDCLSTNKNPDGEYRYYLYEPSDEELNELADVEDYYHGE